MPEQEYGCGLYLITPSEFELGKFTDQLKQAFDGGDVACLQLRMKTASEDEILKSAEAILPICHEHETTFIINDYPQLLEKSGADGVHIGDEDIPTKQAREIIGDKILGVSCYSSRDRAIQAGEDGADYIAFGQFYETRTKPAKGRPEPEILEWWSTNSILPCVAIGGIKPDNCGPLIKAGADFIAVVTGVWNHPEGPKKAIEDYNRAIQLALN